MTTDPPTTAVLVLNYNGRRHLEPCFESLLALDGVTSPHLWLIDNASHDGSVELVTERFPTVHVMRLDRNLGFPGAYDRAVESIDAPWIVFLNNDTRVAPDWLVELHACRARHPDAWAVASRILSWDGRRVDFDGADTFFFGHALQHDVGASAGEDAPEERRLLFGCAGSLLVHRDTFRSIGGFDADYFSFSEDVDLGWRASALGHETWFAPKAVTFHRLHASWGGGITPRKRFLVERNALCNVIKNYEPTRGPVLLLVSAALAFLRGWWAGYGVDPGPRLAVTTDALCHSLAIAAVRDRLPGLTAWNERVEADRRRRDVELVSLFGALASPPLPPEPEYRCAFEDACRIVGDGDSLVAWDGPTNVAALAAFSALAANCELAVRHRASEESLAASPDLATLHRVPYAISQMLEQTAGALGAFLAATVVRESIEGLRLTLDQARPRLIEGLVYDPASSPDETPVDVTDAPGNVAVVVRTQDRPEFLRRALASVAAQSHAADEVIVVCDGGPDPSPLLAEFPALPLRLVHHARSLGRSQAAQSGLEAAGAQFVTFLDDDDELRPDHLATLCAGIGASGLPVAYSDVECLVLDGERGDGAVSARSVFGDAFDPQRLLFENTIPFMAVLMERRLALEVGGFDPELEYFEDWDLWLRLARRTPFHHCPRVTATYCIRPALGHGTATSGAHRWPHMARLLDKHRDSFTGEAWAHYFREYVEPSRQRVERLADAVLAEQVRVAELRAALETVRTSRSWRWTAWIRRILGHHG